MIRVVSLFCGIGGSDAGLYAAARDLGVEVEVVAAYDSWAKAVAVYNANLPHPVAQVADVKALALEDLPPHDLVIGGPPCQPYSLAGKRMGADDPRDCLQDFVRLSAGSAWVMENVVPRLLQAPFSVKLNAFEYGDVTTRKRWFYSDHLLYVIPTPGPRRFGHIRDHEADRIAVGKRPLGAWSTTRKSGGERLAADYAMVLGSITASSLHGANQGGVSMVQVGMRSHPQPYTLIARDGTLGSITQHTHDQSLRRAGQSRPTQDDDVLGTLTAGKGGSTGFLKVGLRGHSASAFEDDEPLGSFVSNSWHGNELAKLGPAVRCPSLLEMARAHSIADSWDWCNATKTDRGKMIANSWPIGLATAVMRGTLVAMGAVDLIAGAA